MSAQRTNAVPPYIEEDRVSAQYMSELTKLMLKAIKIAPAIVGRKVGVSTLNLVSCGKMLQEQVTGQLATPSAPNPILVNDTSTVVEPVDAAPFNLKTAKKNLKACAGLQEVLQALQDIRNEHKPFAEFYSLQLGTVLSNPSVSQDDKKWFKQVLRPILRCYEKCSEGCIDTFMQKCKDRKNESNKAYGEEKVACVFTLYTSAFKKGCPCQRDCKICYAQQK